MYYGHYAVFSKIIGPVDVFSSQSDLQKSSMFMSDIMSLFSRSYMTSCWCFIATIYV